MSDKIKFTLDGVEVEANEGMSIWEVANGRGLVIPHLCHKPAPRSAPDMYACLRGSVVYVSAAPPVAGPGGV